jgi:hypothetical protein
MSDNEMEVDKAAEAGPSSKAKGKGGKRFEIKKWSAVAMWSWAVRGRVAGSWAGVSRAAAAAAAGRACRTLPLDCRAAPRPTAPHLPPTSPPLPPPTLDLHRHVRHLPQQPVRAQH